MRDMLNNIHPVRAISPVSVANDTPAVSQIIDTRGYDSLTFVIQTGSVADADATFAVTMDHDDVVGFGTATPVAATDIVGTLALAGFNFGDDDETRKVGYIGAKRFVRLTITPAGNASAALISAVAILGHPAQAPTPNPPV